MKSLKNIAALAAAAALSLTIASCAGSGAPSPDAAPSGADTPIEELVKVNGVAVHLDENNKTATVEIEVAEGESLDQAGERLKQFVLEIASGKQTNSEKNGFREISIWKDGVVL